MTPPTPLKKAMSKLLSTRKSHSSLRALTTSPATSIDFSSNDFLSLSTSPHLKSLYLSELSSHPQFRIGSGGSRLLDGNSSYAEDLEKEIAEFHGAEKALLFNSGFDANSGFFACVPQPGDLVVHDQFIHASVHEGMKLSRATRCVAFKHNSVKHLQAKIEAFLEGDSKVGRGDSNVFIAVEALYSMDGDLCPLKEVVECVERLLPRGNGHVVVDEAHSGGVYEVQGRGVVCSLGLERRVFARLHTFGKALGANGAAMLCDALTREYLINYAKPLIYTTSMGFPTLAAIKTVYALMARGETESLITHLHSLIHHLYSLLLTLPPTPLLHIPSQIPESPIFSLITPHPRDLARYCQERGYIVRAIVPPTVPEGTQRVRVCLHGGNGRVEVEGLVGVIGAWVELRTREGRRRGMVVGDVGQAGGDGGERGEREERAVKAML